MIQYIGSMITGMLHARVTHPSIPYLMCAREEVSALHKVIRFNDHIAGSDIIAQFL